MGRLLIAIPHRPRAQAAQSEAAPLPVESTPTTGERWIVTVYDNDTNTYEEVITILMIATNCTPDEAWIETWEIDHLGHSVVHCGDEADCVAAAEIISTIGIHAEATPDL